MDENITNYGATRIIPSRFVENNWEEDGVRDFAFHEFRSVPFRSRSHFGQREWIATVLSRFPLHLIAAPLLRPRRDLETTPDSLIISLGKRKIRTRKFVRNGCERRGRGREGEREYLLPLPLRIDQSYSRTSESRKRVFKRRKGEKAGYLKARPSFSFLLENKEQHSRLEHRPPPCPCLLTVINARPLMCTLRRGYRLNDAQLAKKPGTMAARDPPSPPSPCSDRQRDISRETGELSNRVKPNRPRFRFAKMGIIQRSIGRRSITTRKGRFQTSRCERSTIN